MDSRALAALLSSLVSQLLLILLIFPSSPFSLSSPPLDSHYHILFSLLHHFLFSSEIATTVSLFPLPRKRKRTTNHFSDSESDSDDPQTDAQLGSRLAELERVDSRLLRNPDSFRLYFRMTASTFEWLAGLLEPLLDCRDPIGSPIDLSPELRLGVGLYRLSTGSNFPEIATLFGVTEPVAKFCAKQLCRVLCTNFRFWLGFPSPDELKSVSDAFETLTELPNCCGVIDCTRFLINRVDQGHSKGESIAAQIVVDSTCRILSIVCWF
ncbi:hypothetical protein Ancab_017159 [Ancistrocladus abbreviatus]